MSEISPADWTFGRAALARFALDPGLTYLNHGTVGAPPKRVLAAQQALRDEAERNPARFQLRELAYGTDGRPSRMRAAAARVAAFVGANAEDVVFVDNTSAGVIAVLRSAPLRPGQAIAVTSLGYGAVTLAAQHVARERGLEVHTVDLPHPLRSEDDAVAAFADLPAHVGLVIVDHIVSDTAVVLPLQRIAALCRSRGALVLGDGAHGPGSLPLDIPSLGVDWYVGNLHKWAWTPRSSGILWVDPRHHALTHPPVISWGLGQGLAAEFDLAGTRDVTAHLAAPAALDLLEAVGFERVLAWNHGFVWDAAHALADRLGTSFATPRSMVATMAAVPLPSRLGSSPEDAAALRTRVFAAGVEAHVGSRGGRLHVRIAGQIYNEPDDVDRLAAALG